MTGTSAGGGGGAGGFGYLIQGAGAFGAPSNVIVGGNGGGGGPSAGISGNGGDAGSGIYVAGTAIYTNSYPGGAAADVRGGNGGGGGGGTGAGTGGVGGAGGAGIVIANGTDLVNHGYVTGGIAGAGGYNGNFTVTKPAGAAGAGIVLLQTGSVTSDTGKITGGRGNYGQPPSAGGAGIVFMQGGTLVTTGTPSTYGSNTISGGLGGPVPLAGASDAAAGGAGVLSLGPLIVMNTDSRIQGGLGGNSSSQSVAVSVGGTGGAGVSLLFGGTLSNLGVGAIAGGVGGYGSGTQAGEKAQGIRYGAGGAGVVGAGLVVTNAGTIVGGNGRSSPGGNYAGIGGVGGIGVQLTGGTITNTGSITGGAGGASNSGSAARGSTAPAATKIAGGVAISGSNLTIFNAGGITGGVEGDLIAGSGQLITAGTARSNAITFTGGVNTLTLLAGSNIVGRVQAFSNQDTLGLGGTSNSTFNIGLVGATGSAAQYQNFGILQKTGTSTFTLSGVASSALAYQVAGGTLDLGGTSQTLSSLQLTNGALQNGTVTSAGAIDARNGTISANIAGAGALTKSTAGTVVLSGTNTYTGGTKVVAGTLSLGSGQALGSGPLSLANGTTLGFINPATLANAVALTGTGDPTIDTGANAVTLAGVISGPGALTKIGTGTLTLSAVNTYTGPTEVAVGTLLVTGSALNTTFTVDPGAALGGSGAIGGLTIASGATLAPGVVTPFSTLSTGAITFASGSTYTVQVNAAGQTDAINATGKATLQGGTVNVIAGAGVYSPTTTYTILSATGGVAGTFAALTTTSNLAFLTPSLAYGANTVTLAFAPATTTTTTVVTTPVVTGTAPTTPVVTTTTTAVGTGAVVGTTVATVTTATGTTTTTTVVAPVLFASVAATPNQRASANAIQGVSTASPLYAAVLSQSAAGARLAFDAASGEGHASAATALIEDTAQVREAITGRLDAAEREVAPTGPFGALGLAPATSARSYAAVHKGYDTPVAAALAAPPAPAYALWGSAFGAFGRNGANGNAAALERSTGGFVIGGDTRIDAALFSNWRVGIAGGYTSDAIRIGARATSGTVESYFAGLYAGALYGPVDVKLGVLAGGTSTSLRRTVAFPGFIDATRANYGGTIVQGFGELGYRFSLQRGFVEPVLQAAAIHLDQDRFREIGGAAALNGFARSTDVGTTTLGLKGEVALSETWPIVARGLIGYRHAFGDVNPKALLAFASGSTPFTVTGAPIDRDALATELGLDWRATQSVTLGLSYAGQYGARASDSAIRGRMEVKF